MSTADDPPESLSTIPILLLKTRSQPHDTYEEHLSSSVTNALQFKPQFIPVLEHKQNESTLSRLGQSLASGILKERYGGMIFTSQRAVEAWTDVVLGVEKEQKSCTGSDINVGEFDLNNTNPSSRSQSEDTAIDTRSGQPFQTDILTSTPFPLYVVGPATARALNDLFSSCATVSQPSRFLSLRPQIHGSSTGSGAVLAPFILNHYNTLHSHKWFTFHDAPRLPFIPLLGMGSENYSRRRLEPDDSRLTKKPLLFLVGETRRDIIPKTLMDIELGDDKVQVDEVEVYSTVVKDGFREEFEATIETLRNQQVRLVVVVVFSPQGAGDMLRSLGFVDDQGSPTDRAKARWVNNQTPDTAPPSSTGSGSNGEIPTRYVIVTIGPTTRDHLINEFGFQPDVCAKKPSPEGIMDGVKAFLETRKLI